MTRSLENLTQTLLELAKSAGADASDAVAVDATSISIDVRASALEYAERSERVDVGLRVLVGQRQACVAASDTKDSTLRQMAERAVAMAKEAPVDPYAGLASSDQLAKDRDVSQLELFDPSDEPDPAKLQDLANQAEAAAMNVKGVSQVQSASAGYSKQSVHVSASNGFSGGYRKTSNGLSCVAISGEGPNMERDYDFDSRMFHDDLRSPDDIGRTAAERAVAGAGARRPKTGAFPVLFDERVAASLIDHLLTASNGSTVARGSGWLRDLLGQQVLPTGMSIIEEPRRKRASGSRLFDAEGLPTAQRAIIDNGVLIGWTLDLSSARKLDMQSTANAARSTSTPPTPSVTNIALTQGNATRDDLLKQMGTGLLVTGMIGSTINPNTGDYSRGANGFWVENGEITYPVNECTIAGNLRDMLKTLIAANDARTYLSRVVPSLLVEGLTLAGD